MIKILRVLPFICVLLMLQNSVAGQLDNLASVVDKRPAKSNVKLDKRDRIDMAIQQEYEMTMDPSLDGVPRHRLVDARALADHKRKDKQIFDGIGKSGIQGIQWTERGPNNVGGRTRSILVDASDATGLTVFAGSVAGGLWKTTQANASNPNWQKVDDFIDNLAVSSIVQDPNNLDVLYFSTGEGYYNIDAVQGNGIYKSTDHGVSWTHLASTDNSNFHFTQKLIIDSNGRLYAGTYADGLQMSIDGGLSFQKVLGVSHSAISDDIADIELASNGDLYVSIGIRHSDGIYKSEDSGSSWVKLTSDLPTTGYSRIELATAPSDSNYVYAIFNEMTSDSCLGIFRSTNMGDNWVEIDNPRMYGNKNFLRTQGWYNITMAVDPLDESSILIGGIDLFKSTNAGLTFDQVSQWYGAQGMEEVHADQHAIVFAPGNSDLVYFGNDGGVYMSENASMNELTFNSINQGYNVTQFYSADFHPAPGSNIMSAGAQDNGTQLFSSSGVNATQELTGGDGGMTHFDQDNGNIIITTYVYNNFRVSDDMGNDFSYRSFGNTGRFINPNDYDDASNVIYSAHDPGIFLRWNDPTTLGYDYDLVDLSELGTGVISTVLVSPNVANRVYFGTGDGRLIVLDDANTGISKTGELLYDGTGYMSCIAVEEGNEDHIIVSFSNFGIVSLFESTDGGANWNSVEGDLPDMPVRWVVFNPHNNSQALIATELGVWSTALLEGENTIWEPSNGGLANVRTDMIKIRSSDKMLLAATHGRGLFTSNYFAVPQVNLAKGEMMKYEDAQFRKTSGCQLDYTELIIPVSVSSAPYGNAIVELSITGGSAIQDQDFVIETDMVSLNSGNLQDEFVIHIIDDAIQETAENILAEILVQNADVGSQNEIEILLGDNDGEPSLIVNEPVFQLGNGNLIEKNTPFKSYYEDERSQYIFTKDELAAGGLKSGYIKALAFNVLEKNSSIPFSNFTIKLAHTDLLAFPNQNPSFVNNPFTTVYSAEFNTMQGWNTINFDSNFEWDGSSSLIIEICFDNTDYSADDKVEASMIDFYGVQYRFVDISSGCVLNSIPTLKMVRPNIRFTQEFDLDVPSQVVNRRSPTEYPAIHHFYNENSNVIAGLEHDNSTVSSCVEVELSKVGNQIETPAWLSSGAISEKQFYFDAENDFYGSVTLYFSLEELVNWTNPDELNILRTDLRISETNSASYDIISNSQILKYDVTDNIVAYTFLTNKLGGFALTSAQSTTVPVELVNFSAERNGQSNKLNWDVENEYDLDNYVVERGFDGRNFEDIAVVQVQNLASFHKTYQYEDRDLFFSDKQYYYRLRIVDLDGTFKYSDIAAVYVAEESKANVQIYPNPVSEKIFIELKGATEYISKVNIYSTKGQLVRSSDCVVATRKEVIEVSSLMPGIYVVEILDSDGQRYTKTIIKS